MRLAYIVAAGLLWGAGLAHSSDLKLYSDCNKVESKGEASILCDFRASSPEAVKRVSLTANGKALADTTFTSFEEGDGKAAWLFLIDRSNPKREKTVERSVALVKQLYSKADNRNVMGVATFAGDLQVLISPGDPYADIDNRLKDVKADGVATAFYFTALQSIDILKKVDAQRRALVIISDGKAEDTAYSHADVIKRAKEAGVIIYGIGFAEKAAETVDLQKVERLASETGGPYVGAVRGEPLPSGFVDNFTGYLKNGGSVSAPLGDLSGEIGSRLNVVFGDGTTLSSDPFSVYVKAPTPKPQPKPVAELVPPPPVVVPPLPLIAKIYKNFEMFAPNASGWAAANQNAAWALLLIPLALIAAGLATLVILRSREQALQPLAEHDVSTEEEGPHTEPLPVEEARTIMLPGDTAYAYFEMLGDEARRFDIREQNVTIGRHSENDFQINDETVHRHHAVFHMSPDRLPMIADLDTVNGVIVNGKRVSKTELKSGDIIELGEAKFHFVAI